LTLSRPVIMGILNITPDSFSDGGTLFRNGRPVMDGILARAELMWADGAAILDIGGESTRPGAVAVSPQQEADRVLPVLEQLAARVDVILSVDTSNPAIMREAASLGAGMLNDVRALERPGALAAAAATGLPVCLMHMRGDPQTMQQQPCYTDALQEVLGYLDTRVNACLAAGMARARLLLDPGFGFGKSVAHNLQLLQGLPTFVARGMPVLVGLSRKSLIGALIGRPVEARMPASVALALLAVARGAHIVRCHDVRETADALAMFRALEEIDQR